MSCAACHNLIAKEELLVCSGCQYSYHYTCLNIPEDYFKNNLQSSNKWRCMSCNNVTRRAYRDDGTPVRRHYEPAPSSPADADMSISEDSQRLSSTLDPSYNFNNTATLGVSMEALSSLLDYKLGSVKRDLFTIDTKLNTIKQEIFTEIRKEFTRTLDQIKQEFTQTTDHITHQIKGFQADLSAVDKRVKSLEQENSRLNAELLLLKNNPSMSTNFVELQEKIEQMHSDLNDRDQAQLLNDIEIVGVPEYQGESVIHIAQALAQKVGMSLNTQDVVSAERVGPLRAAGTAPARPRPLVVRLARRPLRDELLRNARVRRGMDSGNIGLPEHNPNPVYINERLTKTNRKLLWQARQAGNAAGWKFVWTKEGRILARKTDSRDSKTVRIMNEKIISSVFGVDQSLSKNN